MQSVQPTLLRLVFAKDFRDRQTRQKFVYHQNRMERWGDGLRRPLGSIADLTLREIRNPVMILSVTLFAAAMTTLAFYPTQSWEALTRVLPFTRNLSPWILRDIAWAGTEATILGIGMRALGRIRNPEFYQRWQGGELEPVYIGDRGSV